MIVTCKMCKARFRLADDKVGADGVKVRCSKCRHTFTARRADEPEVVRAEDVIEVDADDPAQLGSAIHRVSTKTFSVPTLASRSPESDAGQAKAGPPPLSPAPSPKAPDPADFDFDDPHEKETSVGPHPAMFGRDSGKTGDRPEFGAETVEMSAAVAMAAIERSKTGEDIDLSGRPAAEPSAEEMAHQADAEGAAPAPTSDPTPDPFAAGGPGLADPFAAPPAGPGGSPAELDSGLFSDLQEGPDASPEPVSEPPSIGLEPRPPSGPPRRPDRLAEQMPTGPAATVYRVLNHLVTGLVVVLVVLGVIYFFSGGRMSQGSGRRATDTFLSQVDGAAVVSMRSVTYPTRSGHNVLVIVGEAENSGDYTLEDLFVEAEIKNGSRVLGSATAPLGIELGPMEIDGLSDSRSIEAAILKKAAGAGDRALLAGTSAPFTVVIPDPPRDMDHVFQVLTLFIGEPLVFPEPKPGIIEPPVEEKPSKSKRKKRKRKKKRRKKQQGEVLKPREPTENSTGDNPN